MQLAHLLPYLDAEIERLQKARDLLALTSSFPDTFNSEQAVSEQAVREPSFVGQSLPDTTAQKQVTKPAAAASILSLPNAGAPQAPSLSVRLRSKTRRTEMPDHSLRAGRRKRVLLSDTALRGLVPSGPVVVSAEEVRKSQASKTAQTTRAAEVRRAGSELLPSSSWRMQTNNGRDVASLLQRLMNIGEDTVEGSTASFPASARVGATKPTLIAAGLKLD